MRTPAIIRHPRVDAFRRSLAATLGRLFGAAGEKAAAKTRITPSQKPARSVYRLEGAVEFGLITMDGSVPSSRTRASLRDEFTLSRTRFDIHDRTQVRDGAPEGWEDAAHAAVEAMTLLRSGHVSVKDTVVMVGGVALHHAGHERLKELHGGRKGRNFTFNAGAVSPPIPAAPMGPPPIEAKRADPPASTAGPDEPQSKREGRRKSARSASSTSEPAAPRRRRGRAGPTEESLDDVASASAANDDNGEPKRKPRRSVRAKTRARSKSNSKKSEVGSIRERRIAARGATTRGKTGRARRAPRRAEGRRDAPGPTDAS